MSRPFKNEIIGGDGKRRYRIATESDGRATITKDYVPEVEGDKFGANVINKLMDIGDDGEPRPIIVTTLVHSKSGNVHTLKGFPTINGIYQGQFVATADFTEGDTFNGYTAKPMGEELTLPDKCFVVGDLVSLTIDTENKKLSFKVGGGGALKPKIYVQLTAPENAKDGEYWVQDEGYKLTTLIVAEEKPKDIQNQSLFVQLGDNYKKNIPLIKSKYYNIVANTYDAFIKINGEIKIVKTYVRVNAEWVLLTQFDKGRLYVVIQDNGSYFAELDKKTLTIINRHSANSNNYGIGGMGNRLFITQYNSPAPISEVDADTFTILNFKNYASDLPFGIGGTDNKLFCQRRKPNELTELNPNTLTIIKTKKMIDYTTGVGCMNNRLFISKITTDTFGFLKELNPDNFEEINTSTPAVAGIDIGGTETMLFTTDGFSEKGIFKVNTDTLTIIQSTTLAVTQTLGIGGTKI